MERGIWERSERRSLYRLAERIAAGGGKEIVTFLGRLLEETLGNTHRSDDLRTALRERGFAPLDLAHDPRVSDAVERLQRMFRSALEPQLIGAGLVPRPESAQLVERVCADGGARLVFVTGDAGSGKSGVLLGAVSTLRELAVPVLPIRLDTHHPEATAHAYSTQRLGLPASPAACLCALADGRRAVLVIDQLDAVRWTSANSDAGWELCKDIIDEGLRSSNISVVVAGRTVDLEDDPRIQHWKAEAGTTIDLHPLKIGPMPQEAVVSVVERYGVSYALLASREKELLSNAQNLQLWWRLADDGKAQHFSSRAELLRSFWGHYRERAHREYGATSEAVNGLLDALIEYMDANGRLDAPNTLLERHGVAADAIRKLGILTRTDGTTRFAHQSHLDYLTIEKVFREALSAEIAPIDWLRERDQSLFRRDQVRFLLQLLRDEDPRLYLEFLEELFFGEGVRFHIQHLALTTIANASPPTDDEHAFMVRLWKDDAWHRYILEWVLARHEPWLERLTDDGTIPAMLSSGDQIQQEDALRLCYHSADAAPGWFERILSPYWNSGDPDWAERIGSRLGHDPARDTPAVFQWRLEQARAGANQPEVYSADQLAKTDPVRAISYLAAIAEGLTSNVERAAAGSATRRFEVDSDRFKRLLDACENHPRLAWNALLPVHTRAVALEARVRSGRAGDYVLHESASNIVSLLSDFLVTSGTALLDRQGAEFLIEVAALGQPPATSHAKRLAVHVLATAPDVLADQAISCFLLMENPLHIEAPHVSMWRSGGLSPQDPAIGLLTKLASVCSATLFQCVERDVLSFHADYERRTVEQQLASIREETWGGHPNCYGLAQYALLAALPEERLSEKGSRALRAWRGKFGDLSESRHSGPVAALPVVSPIPSENARFLSNKMWVAIISRTWSDQRLRRREMRDRYIETSPRTFASTLEQVAKLDPGRYLRLGLRFPGDADQGYYSSLLRAAALSQPPEGVQGTWVAAPVSDVEALIAHIAKQDDREIALAFCRIVEERSVETWSASTLERLSQYALNHPDPDVRSWADAIKDRGETGSLEMTVLNSVRCTAIRAVSQLLWAHPDLLGWATHLAERVIQDEHPAVRAASLALANAIAKHDQDLALSFMVRACEGTEIAILAVLYGQHMLQYVWEREEALAPLLARALASPDEKTAELGAYWTTVAHVLKGLYRSSARQLGIVVPAAGIKARASNLLHRLITRLFGGRTHTAAPHRIGSARGLIDVARFQEDHRAICLEQLAKFLDDEDERVLDAADSIFRTDGFLDTDEAPTFASRFALSAAFMRDPTSLLHPLTEHEGSLLPYSAAIETCVARTASSLLSGSPQVAHRHRMAGRDIATVLLRLYQQSEHAMDAVLKARCLDQWDALLKARNGVDYDVLRKLDS